jgi:hypothetical protein
MVACQSHYNRPELKCCSSMPESPNVELAILLRVFRMSDRRLGPSLRSPALSGIEFGLRAHVWIGEQEGDKRECDLAVVVEHMSVRGSSKRQTPIPRQAITHFDGNTTDSTQILTSSPKGLMCCQNLCETLHVHQGLTFPSCFLSPPYTSCSPIFLL